MKLIPMILTACAALALTATAHATPGDLDRSFAGDGVAQLELGVDSRALATARQPDGRIVLAGSAAKNGGDLAVARLLPDGAPDLAFGDGGVRTIDFGSGGADKAEAVGVDADGRIVVAGSTLASGGSGRDIAVARLTPAGALDASFGFGGTRRVSLGGDEAAHGLAITAGGRVVLVGEQTTLGDTDMIAVALKANGAPDDTFGSGGVVDVSALGAGLDLVGRDVAAVAGGDLVIAGGVSFLIPETVAARLTPAGTLRSGWGDGGVIAVRGVRATQIGADPEDRIVLAGRDATGYAAMRLSPAGQPDLGYGVDGVARVPIAAAEPLEKQTGVTGVEHDAGRTYLSGTVSKDGLQVPAVAALDGAGRLDAAFGGDGIVTPGLPDSVTADAALLADDRLVLAGARGTDMAAVALATRDAAPPAGEPAPPGEPAPTGDRVAPALTGLQVDPRRVRTTARISFRLSEPARVRLTIRRPRARRILAGVTVDGKAGANRLRLRKRLRPAAYRLTAVATDGAGNRSATRSADFRVVRTGGARS